MQSHGTIDHANVDHLMRQLDIIPMECLNKKITVIGAGAIDSFTVLSLSKMGFQDITVYDHDDVSVENMSCQWFRHKDIGQPKTDALKSLILDFTNTEITSIPERYLEGTFPGLVITAVDSMSARRNIWEQHVKFGTQTDFIIDPRMSVESAMMYVMDPKNTKDIASYEKTLYSDADSVQERCTAKATMYTAAMIAGLVAKAVKDIVTSDGARYPRVSLWNIAKNNLLSYARGGEIENLEAQMIS